MALLAKASIPDTLAASPVKGSTGAFGSAYPRSHFSRCCNKMEYLKGTCASFFEIPAWISKGSGSTPAELYAVICLPILRRRMEAQNDSSGK